MKEYEYEYDYKQIFILIEKYISSAKEAAFDELANKNATAWDRCESYGKYSALANISGSVDMLKNVFRKKVKNENNQR